MIDIRSVPAPLTQIDPAPKPASRNQPDAVPVTSTNTPEKPLIERRRNPDRRGERRGGSGPIDRRTGADRRRRTVDISV